MIKKEIRRLSRLIWCMRVLFCAIFIIEVKCFVKTLFPFSGDVLALLVEIALFVFTVLTCLWLFSFLFEEKVKLLKKQREQE